MKKIIAVTEYPVVDLDSVRFLREVIHVNGSYKLHLTRDPQRAQKFGAEIHAVAQWLTNRQDAGAIVRARDFSSIYSFNVVDSK
uniref:Uncharacterized protein n=1 Tax=Pseudomonas phage RVTF4 TaxID=3236931 RepID=A0AB39CCC6_9VIRU